MAAPPVPPDCAPLAGRTFAFYPPILNVEYNEWLFRKATWSEMLVVNAKSDLEVWIPRRLVGEISRVDEPVMIIGLLKELEYRAGAVWPHERKIIEMPRPMEGVEAQVSTAPAQQTSPKRKGIGAETPESRISRFIVAALATTVIICLMVFAVLRLGSLRPVKFTATDQDFLSLTRHDDYFDVVRKLGQPTSDRWRAESGELQYRALWYPQRSYYIILLGSDRNNAHYIGALDRNWHVVHYVDVQGNGSTASILRSIPRF